MPRPPRRPFRPGQPKNQPAKARPPREKSAAGTAWDPVAAWYDKLVGESGSDYHRNVILPAALRLLGDVRGQSVIDLCCGQGVLATPLLEAGAARFTGVDASPQLIAAARQRHGRDARASFHVADATKPGDWEDAGHDAAACLMAVHDVDDLEGLCARIAGSLKPGGRAVLVFMHPCFRIPRQTHWGWDNDQKIQFRRIDRYTTPVEIPIATHPGKGTGEQTVFHHRPLADVLNALGKAGLAVTASEEPCSHRRSQPGPFSKAEHRAAAEIPVFLALHAVKA